MSYQVDENGFYGEFGGAYISEILYKCVDELRKAYLPVIESEEFRQEFRRLLQDYAGRPSPLYYAERMSRKYGCRLFHEGMGLIQRGYGLGRYQDLLPLFLPLRLVGIQRLPVQKPDTMPHITFGCTLVIYQTASHGRQG